MLLAAVLSNRLTFLFVRALHPSLLNDCRFLFARLVSDFRVLSCKKKKFKFFCVFQFAVDLGVQRGGKLRFTRC